MSNQRSVRKVDSRRKVHRPKIKLMGKLAKINGEPKIKAAKGSNAEPSRSDEPGGMNDPQYTAAPGKKLKIVTSNAPTLAKYIKPKHSKKPVYKRD